MEAVTSIKLVIVYFNSIEITLQKSLTISVFKLITLAA